MNTRREFLAAAIALAAIPAVEAQDTTPTLFEQTNTPGVVRFNRAALNSDHVFIKTLEGERHAYFGRRNDQTPNMTWWGPVRDADRPVAWVQTYPSGVIQIVAVGMREIHLHPLPNGLYTAQYRP